MRKEGGCSAVPTHVSSWVRCAVPRAWATPNAVVSGVSRVCSEREMQASWGSVRRPADGWRGAKGESAELQRQSPGCSRGSPRHSAGEEKRQRFREVSKRGQSLNREICGLLYRQVEGVQVMIVPIFLVLTDR
jgi:hypothetical protein